MTSRTSLVRSLCADAARALELGRLFDECALLTLLVTVMCCCAYTAI